MNNVLGLLLFFVVPGNSKDHRQRIDWKFVAHNITR